MTDDEILARLSLNLERRAAGDAITEEAAGGTNPGQRAGV